jgi:hypothetical protein
MRRELLATSRNEPDYQRDDSYADESRQPEATVATHPTNAVHATSHHGLTLGAGEGGIGQLDGSQAADAIDVHERFLIAISVGSRRLFGSLVFGLYGS